MNDIEKFKQKRLIKMFDQISASTKEGAYAFAESCFALAYKVKEYDSRLKANQRNLDKINSHKGLK